MQLSCRVSADRHLGFGANFARVRFLNRPCENRAAADLGRVRYLFRAIANIASHRFGAREVFEMSCIGNSGLL